MKRKDKDEWQDLYISNTKSADGKELLSFDYFSKAVNVRNSLNFALSEFDVIVTPIDWVEK